MGKPTLLVDALGKKLLSLVHMGGDTRYPMGVGTKDVGFDDDGTWLASATHAEGEVFDAADGTSVAGGIDDAPGVGVVHPLRTDAAGRLIAVTKASTGVLTDGSGSIATGGTRQEIFAALVDRKYFYFQNISDTDMWINFGTNAVADQPSIKVFANGGGFVMEGGFVSSQRIDLLCATTSKKFVAKQA